MTSSRTAIQHHLARQRAAIDDALAGFARDVRGNDVVSEAVRYALAAGGKRLRPILCLAAADACSPGHDDVTRVRAAAAIELIHTYSLVHDDLPCMDDDDLRRGRPTLHRVFGTRVATVAGLALIPLACRILAESARRLNPGHTLWRKVVSEICTAAGAAGMVGGQVLDLEAEGRVSSLEELRRIHACKTGALFRAALRIGGQLGGGTEAEVDALGRYGDGLGLAFQIADDVLDVTMDAGALGKTPGKDEAASKPTFASLLGVERALAEGRAESERAIGELRAAGVKSPVLEELARFAVDRHQ